MKKQSNLSDSQKLRYKATLVQRGGARAAVLGVNDGLVSTLCLVVGIAAAGGEAKFVLTAGLAGLLAGAISMAAGEWISVRAQVELFEGILDDIKHLMNSNKDQLVHSLAHALTKRGMEKKTAHQAAKDIAGDDEHFIATYSAQVIGLNSDELGSPWRAVFSSFALFTLGSLVPLAPWFLAASGMPAISISITLTAVASLFVGGFVARSSGRTVWLGAVRQLLIVLLSSFVVYGIGYIFGVSVA